MIPASVVLKMSPLRDDINVTVDDTGGRKNNFQLTERVRICVRLLCEIDKDHYNSCELVYRTKSGHKTLQVVTEILNFNI